MIALIRRYQRRGGSAVYFNLDCNFDPTCSEYTCQALEHHGLINGLRLAINRIKRCNNPDALCRIPDPIPE